MSPARTSPARRLTRATLRAIEAGSGAPCTHCDETLRFSTRRRDMQVICNVYVGGAWDRVEQFHLDCYRADGSPHGEVADNRAPVPVVASV